MEISDELLSLMCAVAAGQHGWRYRRLLKKGRKKGLFRLQTRYVLTEKGARVLREVYPGFYTE